MIVQILNCYLSGCGGDMDDGRLDVDDIREDP